MYVFHIYTRVYVFVYCIFVHYKCIYSIKCSWALHNKKNILTAAQHKYGAIVVCCFALCTSTCLKIVENTHTVEERTRRWRLFLQFLASCVLFLCAGPTTMQCGVGITYNQVIFSFAKLFLNISFLSGKTEEFNKIIAPIEAKTLKREKQKWCAQRI